MSDTLLWDDEMDRVVIDRDVLRKRALELCDEGQDILALWFSEMAEATSIERCPVRMSRALATEFGLV